MLYQNLKNKIKDLSIDGYFFCEPKDIIFDDRAILQCFNCKNYGVKHTCPPYDFNIIWKNMFSKYSKCAFVYVVESFSTKEEFDVVRISSTNRLHKNLLELEKYCFSLGCYYSTAFIGGSCKLCKSCSSDKCRQPEKSRIPLEATGVDVMATIKKLGLNLAFPVKEKLYRVGLLLIE